jgi:iron-sulfur cluster assembly accessory protein
MPDAGYQLNWASDLQVTWYDREGYRRRTMTTDVTISDKAARRIGEILKGEGSGAMLRISVEGGGCSGFQYKFDIDRARTDDDLVIEQDNAVVLVDSASQPFLAGSQVDFVDDLIGASFRVNNPNATASCGCGTSFSI